VDRLLLGVDAGNTKTIALVARTDGRIVGAARAGIGDIYGAATPEAAVAEIRQAVDGACADAGAMRTSIAVATFSLAGADWPEDFVYLRHAVGGAWLGEAHVEVVNDAIGALRAGTPDGIGVAVVSGTGDAVGARGPEGRTWHSSFWAQPSGGADDLVREAMRAVVWADLGIGPPTALTARSLALFGETTVEGLLHTFTRREGRRPSRELMRLSPVVLDEADSHDPVASGIVARHARRLAAYARHAAATVGLASDPYPVVLAGGLFRHRSRVLEETLAAALPNGRPGRAAHEPAVGALLLAFDALGVRPDADVLRGSVPPASLFATATRTG
jgi:N-acetylglucosamine kinase-like BadF-type ATPase